MLKLTEHIKLPYVRNLRGNAFKGDILWYFAFSTRQDYLYSFIFGCHFGGQKYALQNGGQNYFLPVLLNV